MNSARLEMLCALCVWQFHLEPKMSNSSWTISTWLWNWFSISKMSWKYKQPEQWEATVSMIAHLNQKRTWRREDEAHMTNTLIWIAMWQWSGGWITESSHLPPLIWIQYQWTQSSDGIRRPRNTLKSEGHMPLPCTMLTWEALIWMICSSPCTKTKEKVENGT